MRRWNELVPECKWFRYHANSPLVISLIRFISKMPSGLNLGTKMHGIPLVPLAFLKRLASRLGRCCVVLHYGTVFFLSFFGLFVTLRLRGRPGRDCCQSALWDCFWGWICHHVEKASPKTVPQCTLTTTSTWSPTQPQSGELFYVAYINT